MLRKIENVQKERISINISLGEQTEVDLKVKFPFCVIIITRQRKSDENKNRTITWLYDAVIALLNGNCRLKKTSVVVLKVTSVEALKSFPFYVPVDYRFVNSTVKAK